MGRDISHDDGWVIPPPILFLFLPKRLRPQARVVGQPPHERRHLGRRQTGRTRKGYAASVSGKAANGCAVRGQKKKCRRRACTCVQVCLKRGSSESVPPFFVTLLPARAGRLSCASLAPRLPVWCRPRGACRKACSSKSAYALPGGRRETGGVGGCGHPPLQG